MPRTNAFEQPHPNLAGDISGRVKKIIVRYFNNGARTALRESVLPEEEIIFRHFQEKNYHDMFAEVATFYTCLGYYHTLRSVNEQQGHVFILEPELKKLYFPTGSEFIYKLKSKDYFFELAARRLLENYPNFFPTKKENRPPEAPTTEVEITVNTPVAFFKTLKYDDPPSRVVEEAGLLDF